MPTILTPQQAIARWEQRIGRRASRFGGGEELLYTPFLLAQIQVRYLDRKTDVNTD